MVIRCSCFTVIVRRICLGFQPRVRRTFAGKTCTRICHFFNTIATVLLTNRRNKSTNEVEENGLSFRTLKNVRKLRSYENAGVGESLTQGASNYLPDILVSSYIFSHIYEMVSSHDETSNVFVNIVIARVVVMLVFELFLFSQSMHNRILYSAGKCVTKYSELIFPALATSNYTFLAEIVYFHCFGFSAAGSQQ